MVKDSLFWFLFCRIKCELWPCNLLSGMWRSVTCSLRYMPIELLFIKLGRVCSKTKFSCIFEHKKKLNWEHHVNLRSMKQKSPIPTKKWWEGEFYAELIFRFVLVPGIFLCSFRALKKKMWMLKKNCSTKHHWIIFFWVVVVFTVIKKLLIPAAKLFSSFIYR